MTQRKTDKEWEQWGKTEPWYGVLSEAKYKGHKLSAQAKKDFYLTGKQHIEGVMGIIKSLDNSFKPHTTVDFGCGTGRLVFALARLSKKVVGIDISSSMIEQAKKNQPKGLKNVSYVLGDGTSNLPSSYNLIHSIIVFQHMRPERGYALTEKFIKGLEPGGFAALHYTVYDGSSTPMKWIRALRRKSKLVNALANLYMRRPLGTPNMQMNMYDMGRLLKIFDNNGITDVRVLTSNPDCYVGVQIIGKKQR